MTNYRKTPTRIRGSISDKISLGYGMIWLRLSLKDTGVEGVVLDLKNVYYLPSSLSNLISLGLLNNHNIYHDNKNKTLYNREMKEVLTHVEC